MFSTSDDEDAVRGRFWEKDVIAFNSINRVIAGAVCISLLTTCLTLLHVQMNYPAEIREVVRAKAVTATLIITFPICVMVFSQMKRNHALTVQLQHLLNRDRLTDVATRDFFFARMEGDPKAFGTSLMVDIDHFKSVNDKFGHLVGDEVIKSVACILRDTVRERDIVCRFGGEEFIIFLFDQGRTDGFELAERMRKKIEEHRFDPALGEFEVTISIGGSLKDRLDDFSIAIKEADDALYQAKARGRNRTVFVDKRCIDTAA